MGQIVEHRNVLHYKGDLRDFDPAQLLGPDRDECFYAIVRVDYDIENDVSTATLRPIFGDELVRHVQSMVNHA